MTVLSKAAQLEGTAGVWPGLSDTAAQCLPSASKFPKCAGLGPKNTTPTREKGLQAFDQDESLRVVPPGL